MCYSLIVIIVSIKRKPPTLLMQGVIDRSTLRKLYRSPKSSLNFIIYATAKQYALKNNKVNVMYNAIYISKSSLVQLIV